MNTFQKKSTPRIFQEFLQFLYPTTMNCLNLGNPFSIFIWVQSQLSKSKKEIAMISHYQIYLAAFKTTFMLKNMIGPWVLRVLHYLNLLRLRIINT